MASSVLEIWPLSQLPHFGRYSNNVVHLHYSLATLSLNCSCIFMCVSPFWAPWKLTSMCVFLLLSSSRDLARGSDFTGRYWSCRAVYYGRNRSEESGHDIIRRVSVFWKRNALGCCVIWSFIILYSLICIWPLTWQFWPFTYRYKTLVSARPHMLSQLSINVSG